MLYPIKESISKLANSACELLSTGKIKKKLYAKTTDIDVNKINELESADVILARIRLKPEL